MWIDRELLRLASRPLQMLARRRVVEPRVELILYWGMCLRLVDPWNPEPIRTLLDSCRVLSQCVRGWMYEKTRRPPGISRLPLLLPGSHWRHYVLLLTAMPES